MALQQGSDPATHLWTSLARVGLVHSTRETSARALLAAVVSIDTAEATNTAGRDTGRTR